MNGETGMPSSSASEASADGSHGYTGDSGNWVLGTLEWFTSAYVTDQYGQAINFETNYLSRDILNFNVYHSDIQGGTYDLAGSTDDGTASEYTHTDPVVGANNYYVVTAVYDNGESTYSEEAVAFVEPDLDESSIDDGSCEGTFDVSMPYQVLAKHVPVMAGYSGVLNYFKFYINEEASGQVVVRIYNEGDNGLPEQNPVYTALLSGDEVSVGWNYIPIDPEVDLTAEAPVFAGILMMAGSPGYGIDTDTQGQTYVGISSSSMSVSDDGNAMFRLLGEFAIVGSDINIVTPEETMITNHPNPFNPETTIEFNIPEDSKVSLKIYNMKGQLVKTMLNEEIESGTKSLTWTGDDDTGNSVSSGLYFYKLQTNSKTITKKMLLLK